MGGYPSDAAGQPEGTCAPRVAKTLLIVRTHRADPETLAAFDRYSGLPAVDVIIGCDERNGAVDTGSRAKAAFDTDMLMTLGLFPHPSCGWRCGDYFYYVARDKFPSYDFYWLVEPDVLINRSDLNATFEVLNASRADFLAPHFRRRNHKWGWHRTVRDSYPEIYGCIFPITRLSARAIDHLHASRRGAAIPQTPAALNGWPNDEAFVATELQNHGFECEELGLGLPGCYTSDTLRTWTPWDRAALSQHPPDGKIYHPVRDLSVWLEGQAAWATQYAIDRRGKVQAHFRNDHLRLVRLADAYLGIEAMKHVALFPLLLASQMTLEASYEAQAGRQDLYIEKQIDPYRAKRMLRRWFSPARSGRVFATGHLLAPAPSEHIGDVAAQSDFVTENAEALHVHPVAFALPYAYDLDDESLLFTMHMLPSQILSADSLRYQQILYATVGFRVKLNHLERFYPIPTNLPEISFLMLGDNVARAAAARRLHDAGQLLVADPPALMQLAKQSSRFLALRSRLRTTALWAAIAPAFMAYPAQAAAVMFIVSDDILSIRGVLKVLLPDAKFLRGSVEAE